MEATHTPDFETFWAGLQEIRQIMKEGAERHDREMKESAERHDQEMKESAERHKEFEREMEKLKQKTEKSKEDFNKRLGNYINLFGEITEYEMSPKMREKFTGFGFYFPKTTRNVSIRDSANDIFLEIDAMLENGDTAILVEIKTELTVERINYHMERIEKMRKYANLRGDKRTFLGAVAGVIVKDDVRKHALKQGLYLIEPAGLDLSITPPYGKPREW